jgi:hypothetical protein
VLTLDLATRAFRRADGSGPTIYLSSAIHIGDKAFYQGRQAELDRCDVVLFEGVKPTGMAEIDAALDDVGKADATRKRMVFLAELAVAERTRTGAFAKDFDGLVADAGRFRSAVERLKADGWGRPIALSLVDVEATDERPAEQRLRLLSLGADGQPGGDGSASDLSVESKAVPIDRGGPRRATETNIQGQLAKALGLAFQLDEIDSSKSNWRNSDIDMEELQELLAKAGSNADAILRMLDGTSIEARLAGFFLSLIGVSETLTTMVKVVMVDMLASADELMGSVDGMEAMQKVIIEDRNRIVLNDLKAVIENEPTVKTIAIFYGAGHMDSMERCLRAEFELVSQADAQPNEWLTAIRVDPRPAGLSKSRVRQMREWMHSTMKSRLKTDAKRR